GELFGVYRRNAQQALSAAPLKLMLSVENPFKGMDLFETNGGGLECAPASSGDYLRRNVPCDSSVGEDRRRNLGTSVASRRVTLAVVLVVSLAALFAARTGEAGVAIPPPVFDPVDTNATGTAVMAGGCFWGVQAVFEHVGGVSQVIAGYSGGAKSNPTYEEVS